MNRRFLGQSFGYSLASIAPIVANFAVTPFVTRILGPESYGVVAVSISLFQFGIVILTLGLAASITRQAIIDVAGTAGAVATLVLGTLLGAVIFLLASVSLPLWGPLVLPGQDVTLLVSPLVSCLGLALLQNSQSLFRAEQRVASFVVLGSAASILAPLVGILMVSYLDPSSGTYLIGVAATHISVGGLAVIICLRINEPKFNNTEFWKNLRIGLPTVPHQVAPSLMTLILVSATSHVLGLEAAGALQLGMLIGSAPMLLLGAMNNAWAPMIYRTPEDDRESLLNQSYRAIMLASVLLIVGFAILAPVVVPIVAGPLDPKFPITQVALITALGTPFMASYLANIHLVFISGRTGVLSLATPASAFIALSLVAVTVASGITADPRMIALSVPLFQVLQLSSSIILRRNRSEIHVSVFKTLPEFGAVVLIIGSSFFYSNHIEYLVPVFLSLLALLFMRRHWLQTILSGGKVLSARN